MTRIVEVPFLIPSWADAQVLVRNTIYVKGGTRVTVGLIAHELVHVDQLNRYGWWKYALQYARNHMKYGYVLNPMEREANRLSRDPRMLTRAREVLAANGFPVLTH